MPLTCGICPMVAQYRSVANENWPEGVICLCPFKELYRRRHRPTHECDVPLEDMRLELLSVRLRGDQLERAIAMREAEAK